MSGSGCRRSKTTQASSCGAGVTVGAGGHGQGQPLPRGHHYKDREDRNPATKSLRTALVGKLRVGVQIFAGIHSGDAAL